MWLRLLIIDPVQINLNCVTVTAVLVVNDGDQSLFLTTAVISKFITAGSEICTLLCWKLAHKIRLESHFLGMVSRS